MTTEILRLWVHKTPSDENLKGFLYFWQTNGKHFKKSAFCGQGKLSSYLEYFCKNHP